MCAAGPGQARHTGNESAEVFSESGSDLDPTSQGLTKQASEDSSNPQALCIRCGMEGSTHASRVLLVWGCPRPRVLPDCHLEENTSPSPDVDPLLGAVEASNVDVTAQHAWHTSVRCAVVVRNHREWLTAWKGTLSQRYVSQSDTPHTSHLRTPPGQTAPVLCTTPPACHADQQRSNWPGSTQS